MSYNTDIKRAVDVFNAAWEGKRVEFWYNGDWQVEVEFDAILECLKLDFKVRIDFCAECQGEGEREVSVYSPTLGMDASRIDECEACGGTGRESRVGGVV